MTTAPPPPPPTEIMTKAFSAEWKEPHAWKDWDFFDLVNCPDLEAYKAKAPQVERPCPHCGRVEIWNAIEAAAFAAAACEVCCNAHNNKSKASRSVSLVRSRLEKTIPPLYRETDRARLERDTTREQVLTVLSWTPEKKKKGLALVGDTRAGKTRTLCLLLEKLIREKQRVRAFFHGAFYDEMLETIRSDRNFRKWKLKIMEEPVVAIDDLFAEKLTERGEASLFEILDARICHHRPTFITTQVGKREGLGRFASVKRAEAFFARLNEFYEVVPCGKPKTKKMELKT